MRLRVLGTLELVVGGDGDPAGARTPVGQAVPLRSPKLRRLLAALLVQANAVVSVDRLADILWGDEPPVHVDASLQQLVSRLRTALRSGDASTVALRTRAPGYLLQVARDALDASRFEDLVARARNRDGTAGSIEPAERYAAKAVVLDEALSLWRGPAYAEFADADFARAEAARLEELRLTVIEDRAEAALMVGRPDEAIGRLEALVAEYPLRERPYAQLILALHRTGRQSDALRAYREHRDRLRDELGLDPSPALQRLEADVLRHDPGLDWRPGGGEQVGPTPPPATPTPAAVPAPPATAPQPEGAAAAAGNLPPAAPALVGRDELLAQLADALDRAQIVTLTGPGGVGKSALALRAAVDAARGSRLGGGFPDGAWLCEVAVVDDPTALTNAVTTVLGIQQRQGLTVAERLVEYLRSKRLLLVLDNCEHLADAAARLVDAVVRGCPDVVVLATSREPLGLAVEHVRPVPPLAVPPPAAVDAAGAGRCAAVTLFVGRAAAAAPGFALTDDNAHAVAELCRRLDGLPLAIELAATRVRSMTPAEIVGRLTYRFRFLRSGRRIAAERHRNAAGRCGLVVPLPRRGRTPDLRSALGVRWQLRPGGGGTGGLVRGGRGSRPGGG